MLSDISKEEMEKVIEENIKERKKYTKLKEDFLKNRKYKEIIVEFMNGVTNEELLNNDRYKIMFEFLYNYGFRLTEVYSTSEETDISVVVKYDQHYLKLTRDNYSIYNIGKVEALSSYKGKHVSFEEVVLLAEDNIMSNKVKALETIDVSFNLLSELIDIHRDMKLAHDNQEVLTYTSELIGVIDLTLNHYRQNVDIDLMKKYIKDNLK